MATTRITPAQLSALHSAAADSHGQLRRTPDGYVGDGTPAKFHSSRAVYALEMLGLVDFVEPGLQSLVQLTDGGRRAAEGFQRALATAAVQA